MIFPCACEAFLRKAYINVYIKHIPGSRRYLSVGGCDHNIWWFLEQVVRQNLANFIIICTNNFQWYCEDQLKMYLPRSNGGFKFQMQWFLFEIDLIEIFTICCFLCLYWICYSYSSSKLNIFPGKSLGIWSYHIQSFPSHCRIEARSQLLWEHKVKFAFDIISNRKPQWTKEQIHFRILVFHSRLTLSSIMFKMLTEVFIFNKTHKKLKISEIVFETFSPLKAKV